MIGGEERWLEVEEVIDATPHEIFPYLTEPENYARWMGAEAELDPRPGGVFRVRMPNAAIALGRFVVVEPPLRVVFTWGWEGSEAVPPGSTTVEITLLDQGRSTLIRLRHTGLPDEAARNEHREGWQRYLTRLGPAALGVDPGPDPGPPEMDR